MANANLTNAKKAKNDEFYTQLKRRCDTTRIFSRVR